MSRIISLTSGGVDSVILTWVLAYIFPEREFQPLYLRSKLSGAYWEREEGSNEKVWLRFHESFPNVLKPIFYEGPEIKVSRSRTSHRNRIYIDAVVRQFGNDPDIIGMSMGITPGWSPDGVHSWTLDEEDHSPSLLAAYLKERKPEWTLFSFADFADYDLGKGGRIKLALPLLGEDWLWDTTACQLWFLGKKRDSYLGEGIPAKGGCGRCHGCVGRSVGILHVLGYDKTPYRSDPLKSRWFLQFAVVYKSLDLFLRGLPYTKDSTVRRVLRSWLEEKLNSE